jgi:hypothetical protein
VTLTFATRYPRRAVIANNTGTPKGISNPLLNLEELVSPCSGLPAFQNMKRNAIW